MRNMRGLRVNLDGAAPAEASVLLPDSGRLCSNKLENEPALSSRGGENSDEVKDD